jgi:cation:H+ antiporter
MNTLMEFLSQFDVIILSLATLILGMVILVKGGDLTIDGAVEIAHHYGMPPLLVGFTIVAFGTSLPELIASINANVNDMPGIAVGGMVGSNISNILFVGGVCAIIAPLAANISALRNDFIGLAVVTLAWSWILVTMPVTPIIGVATILLLIAYVVFQYYSASKNPERAEVIIEAEHELEKQAPKNHKKALIMLLFGLIGLAVGAEFLIRGAVTTARIIGIRESVIGLTIVAIGTSLPELTTCAIAAIKKQGDMIIGNIIGSNIFNLMMVLGGIGMIKSYSITDTDPTMIHQDIPLMIGITAIFIITLLVFKKLPRFVGFLYAGGYLAYIMLLAYQSL